MTEVGPEESDFNYLVYAHLSSGSESALGCRVFSAFVAFRLAPRIGIF